VLVNGEALTVGLWVRLEAKSGRESDLDALLRGAAPTPPAIEQIDVLAAKLPRAYWRIPHADCCEVSCGSDL
jgi:hypothetical protein